MTLDFERPIQELEERLLKLHRMASPHGADSGAELSRLQEALQAAKRRIYSRLTPHQRVQIARHPARPNFRAYCASLADEFYELSGDRLHGDDPAVRGGFARLGGHNVVLVGHDKGTDVKSRVRSNFGMAHPEGYRKVKRLYELAGRFGLPIVALVDTPGAFAGRQAEERGQAWAISADLMALARAPVPTVAVVTGEGGSGGALAMCLADRVMMLENSYLSVIAPEACASIIFRDAKRAAEAAEAMKIVAEDLFAHGIVDEVLPEPLGGAHSDPEATTAVVGKALESALSDLAGTDAGALISSRHERHRRIGANFSSGEDVGTVAQVTGR